jgi:multidrug efflux system membrane fusion protein
MPERSGHGQIPAKVETAPEVEPNPFGLEQPAPAAKPPQRRSSSRAWVWLLVLAVACAAGWYYWSKNTASAGPGSTAAAKGGKRGAFAVPVVAAKARRGDIGVYITGLGSVTPIYTVTIKSRVDGQLMKLHYNEGDLVHEGDLLLEIDPRPSQVQLEQAEGQMIRDQANLANARVDMDRYRKLVAQNAVPEQQLATQRALVTQDEGIVKSDQAQIDNAKLNLVYCNITAPITGRVGLRLVDPGNIVHAADTNGLLVITQIDPISVIFTVAEDDLPVVLRKVAAREYLRADAWDRDDQNKIGSGRLATVDNQIDPTTGSLRLRAVFENKNSLLFPNQFVNVRLLVQQKSAVTLVPNAVIQRSTNSTYVYLVKPDQTVTVRQTVLGTSEGNETEVTSGIAPGDVLVMTGVDKLQEGTKVAVEMADEQAGAAAGGKKK